jgi:prepilin-type N-terminal cleavage/methylation domain-containing protein/prepilin-type processing-associated H-X9-DG protein
MKQSSPFVNPARRGFTLVELLVVVTIIAILVALSVVAVGKVRERAQAANATTALRQVGMAQVSYASENNGSINTLHNPGEALPDGGVLVTNTFWGRMLPYLFSGLDTDNQEDLQRQIKLGLNTLFNTSDVDKMTGTPFAGNPKFDDGSGLSVPLGFNQSFLPEQDQPAPRASNFSDPSRTIYTSYGREFFNATHGETYRPMPVDGGPTASGIYYLSNRKAFICFLDGHVETLTPPISERLFNPQ